MPILNRRIGSTLLTVLVLTSALMFRLMPAGETNQYDLNVPLSSGAHIYVNYESTYSIDDRRVTSGNLTIYLPMMAQEFWRIYRDAVVTMRRSERNTGMGSAKYDAQGNILSYSGTVAIRYDVPMTAGVYVNVLLHEWTHVFQFWIPHYFDVIGSHLEAVASARANTLILEHLGWNTADYQSGRVKGQLVSPLYGLADYLRSWVPYEEGGGGYGLLEGWEELWYHDRQAFNKFNIWVAAVPTGSSANLRDAVHDSLFESYSDYSYDGLPVDDWLSAFSFYNSLSDVPEGVRMIPWEGSNDWAHSIVVLDGFVFVRQGTQALKVPVSSYDVTIYDGQTRELLYSNMNQPVTSPLGDMYYTSGYPSSLPMRDLLRMDVVAHLTDGKDLSITAYLAAQYNERGDRRAFFLNRDGYAEGLGSSNVGTVDSGLVRWTSGNSVEATVTWSGGTYTYVIENVMAHPAMGMRQIAVPLYESRTMLSPVAQTVDLANPRQMTVHLSPKVSSGTVTLYSSRNQVDWVSMASATPVDGYASFRLQFSAGGTHYLKATWTGDGEIDASQSSIAKVEAVATTTLTASFLGNEYTLVINGNVSPTDLLFDPERRLFNFTISGADGALGSFVVLIPMSLLDGAPVVFVDNAPIASTYTGNGTHYFIRFDYPLSTHTVTVGGSNTIPEFPSMFPIMAASILIAVILRRPRKLQVRPS